MPGSVLWLYSAGQVIEENLRREAGARDRPGAVGLRPLAAAREHLRRHQAADLFLDSLLYNAAATASLAFTGGVAGPDMPGRHVRLAGRGQLAHAGRPARADRPRSVGLRTHGDRAGAGTRRASVGYANRSRPRSGRRPCSTRRVSSTISNRPIGRCGRITPRVDRPDRSRSSMISIEARRLTDGWRRKKSASSPGRGRRLPESSAGNCPVILTDDLSPHVERWDTSRELDPSAFAEIRRRMMLEGCKWDPQVGDVATLAPFPIVLPAVVAGALARLAEQLAAEVLAAERHAGGPARLPENARPAACGPPRTPHPRRADPRGGPGHPVRLPPDRRGMADLRGQRRRARRLYRVVAVPPPDGTGLPRDATDGRSRRGAGRRDRRGDGTAGDRRVAVGFGLHGRPSGRGVPGPRPGRSRLHHDAGASPPGLLGGRICPADRRPRHGPPARRPRPVLPGGMAGEPARPLGLAGVLPRGTDARVQPRHGDGDRVQAVPDDLGPPRPGSSHLACPPAGDDRPAAPGPAARPPAGCSRRPIATRATPWHSPTTRIVVDGGAPPSTPGCGRGVGPPSADSRRSPFRRLAGRCTLAWVFTRSMAGPRGSSAGWRAGP